VVVVDMEVIRLDKKTPSTFEYGLSEACIGEKLCSYKEGNKAFAQCLEI